MCAITHPSERLHSGFSLCTADRTDPLVTMSAICHGDVMAFNFDSEFADMQEVVAV